MVSLQKIKDEENILRGRKERINFKVATITLTANLSTEKKEAEHVKYFNMLKNTCQPRVLYQNTIFFKNEGETEILQINSNHKNLSATDPYT